MTDRLLHRDLTDATLRAFFDVHSELGYGFLEAVYANAMAVLLRQAGFRVEREVPYEIFFHGERIGMYRADLVVESQVIVEVKTSEIINPIYTTLVANYLRAAKLQIGLLLNFGHKAQFRRVYSPIIDSSRTS
jgi:GxxExxY protein